MLVYDLPKYENTENIEIRELFAAVALLALVMGSARKVPRLVPEPLGETGTVQTLTVQTAESMGSATEILSRMYPDAVRFSGSISEGRIKDFVTKQSTVAQNMTNTEAVDVTEDQELMVVIVPPAAKEDEIPAGWAEALPEAPAEEVQELVNIRGFLCDEQGMIVGCEGLVITDGVLNIPSDERCKGIRSGAFASLGGAVFEVYVPAGILEIEEGAFDGLTELFYIEVHPANPNYGSENGSLYQRD